MAAAIHAEALPRIFVQITSYRDPECQWTVKDLYLKATHPSRIFVGIFWQSIPEEDDHCFLEPSPYPEQVRITQVDASVSQGACWARAQAQQLWEGEEYVLQLDSHMRFEEGWDETLIQLHQTLPNPRSVLTTYPAGYIPPHEIEHRVTYTLVAKEFNSEGVLTFGSKVIPPERAPSLPIPGAFISGNMLFGPGLLVREVPYDPFLYFFGEEITLSVRLWTHGYDIYHPPHPVLYHHWKRDYRRTHFDDHRDWTLLNRRSYARVRHLLGVEPSSDPDVLEALDEFGLGKLRTLSQYEHFACVRFAERHIDPEARDGWQGHGVQNWPRNPRQNVAQLSGMSMEEEQRLAKLRPLPRTHAKGPRKRLESPDCVVIDDFLPDEIFDKIFEFAVQTDYQYINTKGAVSRVWDLTNGFPLRSEKTVIYYHDPEHAKDRSWAWPSRTPFDLFVEQLRDFLPHVKGLVGEPGGSSWTNFSLTSWLYPQNTGLSLHDDGAGIYTGAYVFYLNRTWRPHWGGQLLVLDHDANEQIQQSTRAQDSYAVYRNKWLHLSHHDAVATEQGFARCIFPYPNRMVFISPRAFHMVTQVTPSAGDQPRMSLAGFFHREQR